MDMQRQERIRTIAFAVLAGVVLLGGYSMVCPKWEYRTLKLMPEKIHDRVDSGAFAYSTIQMDSPQLAELGLNGWEVVASTLEMETAYPNFGKSEYVTGLQPNVRPQALVLVLKRQRLPWR